MPPPPTALDRDLRALYHAPLADFVAERQALAKRLRQAGDARAGEVRGLRKPSLSAWAVNQLFAGETAALAALVDAGERARSAQQEATAGGDPRPLRDLLAGIREQSARLARRAIELLGAAGRAPGEAIVERVRGNLDALALDPAAAEIAARGWLDVDLEPPGFEIMAALQLAAAGPRPAGASEPAADSPRGREAAPVAQIDDRRRAIAERRERERRERLDRLRAELARAEEVAAERQAAAERAGEAAEVAARELAAAEERATEAGTRADDARRRAAEAEAAAARARDALARHQREALS